jgi:hypothetical protein
MTALDETTDRALRFAAAFEQSGEIGLLDRAIALFTEVVLAGADTVPDRARHLDNLGVALLSRFEAVDDREALRRALDYARRATTEGPGRHPDHALHLSNLSNTALAWFDETGDESALDEAVAAGAAAVRLGVGDEHEVLFAEVARAARVRRFEHHVTRAVAAGAAFVRTSSPDELTAAVAAGRAAIADAPADEPRRWTAWSNLSNILRLRFELLGDDEDLEEAIDRARTALSLADGGAPVPDNPDPPSSGAVNLAAALLARLFAGGPTTDADEVIALCRPFAERDRTPPATRHLLLSHLVGALQERARRAATPEAARADLDDAVALGHAVVAQADPVDRGLHLANLANSLLTRDDDGDVAAAIGYADDAAALLDPGTQEWARAAATRATAYRMRWLTDHVDADAEAALDQLMAVARSNAVAAVVRIGAARDAADIAVRCGRTQRALVAARAAVALLPVVAWRGLDRRSRAEQLARWPDVGRDAAAIAVAEEPDEAPVLAELGRGVLWRQTLDARRERNELGAQAPDIAQRLSQVRDALEADAVTPTVR